MAINDSDSLGRSRSNFPDPDFTSRSTGSTSRKLRESGVGHSSNQARAIRNFSGPLPSSFLTVRFIADALDVTKGATEFGVYAEKCEDIGLSAFFENTLIKLRMVLATVSNSLYDRLTTFRSFLERVDTGGGTVGEIYDRLYDLRAALNNDEFNARHPADLEALESISKIWQVGLETHVKLASILQSKGYGHDE